MTQWHADIDTAALSPGARVTVLSQRHVVRVMTADTLSIETPIGHRFSAQVLDRTQGVISLVLDDGTPFALQMEVDESLVPPGTHPSVFSRQVWVAH